MPSYVMLARKKQHASRKRTPSSGSCASRKSRTSPVAYARSARLHQVAFRRASYESQQEKKRSEAEARCSVERDAAYNEGLDKVRNAYELNARVKKMRACGVGVCDLTVPEDLKKFKAAKKYWIDEHV